MRRAGPRRLPRRLPQDPQAAQPRAEHRRPSWSASSWSRSPSRSWPSHFPDATGVTPASTLVSFVRDTGAGAAAPVAVRDPRVPVHRRGDVQRGQPHRRARRAGHRRRADGRSARTCHRRSGSSATTARAGQPRLLRRARPARPRDGRRGRASGRASASCGGTPAPARIFMGDTGSLALGGALAGAGDPDPHRAAARRARRAVRRRHAVGDHPGRRSSELTGRRVFRMAPLHHHFELPGWTENTVIVRFWMVTGMSVAFGARPVLRGVGHGSEGRARSRSCVASRSWHGLHASSSPASAWPGSPPPTRCSTVGARVMVTDAADGDGAARARRRS